MQPHLPSWNDVNSSTPRVLSAPSPPLSSREPSSSVTPSASAWHPTIAAMRQLSRVLSPPRGFHADAAFSAQSPSQVGMEPALALRPVCSVRRHPASLHHR